MNSYEHSYVLGAGYAASAINYHKLHNPVLADNLNNTAQKYAGKRLFHEIGDSEVRDIFNNSSPGPETKRQCVQTNPELDIQDFGHLLNQGGEKKDQEMTGENQVQKEVNQIKSTVIEEESK